MNIIFHKGKPIAYSELKTKADAFCLPTLSGALIFNLEETTRFYTNRLGFNDIVAFPHYYLIEDKDLFVFCRGPYKKIEGRFYPEIASIDALEHSIFAVSYVVISDDV